MSYSANTWPIYAFALTNDHFMILSKSRKSQGCEPVNSFFQKYFYNFSSLCGFAATKKFSIFANREFLERPYTFDFDVSYSANRLPIYAFALANHHFKILSKSRKSRVCEPVNSIFQKYFIIFSSFVL